MAKKTPKTPAAKANPTRADRLDAIVRQVAPTATAHYATRGRWPEACPYVIETTRENGRRIRVTGDDGDTVTGVGATLEEALSALEAKLR